MSIYTSLLTAGTNSHPETSENFNGVATDFVTPGVVGSFTSYNGASASTGPYAVTAQGSPNMTVAVASGIAWVMATPASQGSQSLRVKNTASANVTISANSSGSTKYDWVYIQVDPTKAANPAVDASDVSTLVTSRSSSNTTDNGTPPTYGYNIAVVTVANGASSITNGNISDRRVAANLSSLNSSATTGWTNLGNVPNTVVFNGNRSYTLTFNGTNLTSTLSPGARLMTVRTVAAPTQCTNLNGTTQYYTKTSPAGMAQTDSITIMQWLKPSVYQLGIMQSKTATPGTDGWRLYMDVGGVITVNGNGRYASSYQSLPLNKWVHVAVTLSMSTSTVNMYIDGVSVPSSALNGSGSSFTSAGNYSIGATSSGTNPFAGEIAQAAVFSSVLSQSTIQSYMSQSFVGTESTLISAYSFNNTINDLNSSNANNLTANGSVVATSADSPFGGQANGTISSTYDYGIAQSVTFSTNTTIVVQCPEGCTIPTTGGVSSVSYSVVGVPYGFPRQAGKYRLEAIYRVSTNKTSGITSATWTNFNVQITIPQGCWIGGYQVEAAASYGSSGPVSQTTLSTTNNGQSDARFGALLPYSPNGNTQTEANVSVREEIINGALTPWYFNMYTNAASPSGFYVSNDAPVSFLFAENAYL